MPLNNLPSSLQDIIQTGLLERRFQDTLRAKLGFREIADREPFPAGIGETLTKTRPGLLPAITTPLAPASNTDLTSGLTPQVWPTEQYNLSVAQYAGDAMVNLVTSRVAIASIYLQNAIALAEQAARSISVIAQRSLFAGYMSGNTSVSTTLGAAGTTISVGDIRGFQTVLNSMGQPVPVSSANPMTVTVGSGAYSLTAATPDGTNTSQAPGGISGTLTFSSNVTVADGTAGNAVISSTAPTIIRPSNNGTMASTTGAIAGTYTNGGHITAQMILAAKAQLTANGVPPTANGNYVGIFDPVQLTGLYQDPAFQQFFRGQYQSPEYRRGIVAELLGVDIVETSLNPYQTMTGGSIVRRGIVAGKGALIEAVFTREGYRDAANMEDDGMITIVDDIAHVTREPLDALKQVVTQSWSYIGGFTVPTDANVNPTTLPTASNASLKRAVLLESF